MATLFSTIIAAALVNNLTLVQLLGVSTFFSASRQFSAAAELALLSFLVLFPAACINLLLQALVLEPLHLEFLRLFLFVAVSAGITGLLARQLVSVFPLLARRHIRAVLLMCSNSAIIGLSFLQGSSLSSLPMKLVYSFGAAAGFSMSLLLFAALRQRIDQGSSPAALRGIPLYLISAGIASMALLGFAGLV